MTGKRIAAFAALLTSWALFSSAQAAEMTVYNIGGKNYSVDVKSYKEAKFQRVIKQQYDFSCGSAALATLLTYHYNLPISEREAIKVMYEHGDREKIRTEGFSLLDMKKYLSSLGLKADGYMQPLDKLGKVGIPAIVLLNYNGYLHFVVIKGVSEEEVLVGDPALGIKTIARDEFMDMWNGILFVIRGKAGVAKEHFNLASEWKVRTKAPLEQAMDMQGLSSFTVNLAPANFF